MARRIPLKSSRFLPARRGRPYSSVRSFARSLDGGRMNSLSKPLILVGLFIRSYLRRKFLCRLSFAKLRRRDSKFHPSDARATGVPVLSRRRCPRNFEIPGRNLVLPLREMKYVESFSPAARAINRIGVSVFFSSAFNAWDVRAIYISRETLGAN